MSVLFCTPCYGGMVTEAYLRSCLDLRAVLTEAKIDHDWLTGRNESLVHRARNEMTATFLKTDFERMMWIDADIEFSPDDVAKLWNLDTDIAVGVYPMKRKDKCWYAAWMKGELIKDLDQFSEPQEVDFAGTGFMMIKRSAIEGFVEKYRLPFIDDDAWLMIKAEIEEALSAGKSLDEMREWITGVLADDNFWPGTEYEGPHGDVDALYQTPIVKKHFDSEDYHFCRRWRGMGGTILMDPSVRLVHWGSYGYGA